MDLHLANYYDFLKHYKQEIPLYFWEGAGKKYTNTYCLHRQQKDYRSFR